MNKNLIASKEDLKCYLFQDRVALGKKNEKRPKVLGDEIWKFEIILRKLEYFTNATNSIYNKLCRMIYQYKFHRLSVKLGFSIPINVFGPGLSIAHYGTIVINGNAVVGCNCRIQENVTIGSTGGSSKAPVIGNNVYIGSGAKIIGDICIANNVCVGAGAVVVRSVSEDNSTVVGIPGRVVNTSNSNENLCQDLFTE